MNVSMGSDWCTEEEEEREVEREGKEAYRGKGREGDFCWKAKILPLATIISVVVFEMAGSLVDF